jgi:hypothetical protein
MVLVAKLLGLILKRPQDYYDEPQHNQTPDPIEDKVKESNNGI